MLIENVQAKLMIKCPVCKKDSNEYNWSLQTAARFSIGADTCPTFIMVMLEAIKGDPEIYSGYRVVCPRCYHSVGFEELTLPGDSDTLKYAEQVGVDYCNYWL